MSTSSVDLYWLPLGAGGRSVRVNGLVVEAIAARIGRRPRCDLYHSALEVTVGAQRHVLEMAPVWNERAADRGVVAEGPVGSTVLGRSRLFRYEIRRWREGRIPDVAEAVDSPQRLSDEPCAAARVLALAPTVPLLTWGRDELRTGEMWNSNSVIAWLVACAGIDPHRARVPHGGRAPGWAAGLAVARATAEARSAPSRPRRASPRGSRP